MFVQETGYLLHKRGGMNYTKRPSPFKRLMVRECALSTLFTDKRKRWMNKYMGLIVQIELEHVRVDYRIANST